MRGYGHPKLVVILSNWLVGLLFITSCVSQPAPMPTQSPPPQPSPTPDIKTITANLLTQVHRLQDFMPLEDGDGFVIPTKMEQKAFSDVVSRVEAGDLIYASDLAQANSYTLVRYLDLGDENEASYLLREALPISKGWGLYMIRAERVNNIIVEAPHPLSDKQTDLISLKIYRALNARALLIAGAHRSADPEGLADVAHAPESIFQSVHTVFLEKNTTFSGVPVVLQIHGFAARKNRGYPSIVIGFGQTTSQVETSLAKEIVAALADSGIDAGICDGESWQDLCGTKNVQGSDKKNSIFIHIELDETIRDDDHILIAALVQVFAK